MKKIKLYYIEYRNEIVFFAGDRSFRLDKRKVKQEVFERDILKSGRFELINLLQEGNMEDYQSLHKQIYNGECCRSPHLNYVSSQVSTIYGSMLGLF